MTMSRWGRMYSGGSRAFGKVEFHKTSGRFMRSASVEFNGEFSETHGKTSSKTGRSGDRRFQERQGQRLSASGRASARIAHTLRASGQASGPWKPRSKAARLQIEARSLRSV